jgi:DNA-binding transcriptional LysR family regulator
MEIRQLSYFVKLSEEENYLNAAEELSVSQSQLSKKIMQMEEELGIQLVDRSKRKICITSAGQIVLDYAEDILVAYQSMLRELDALKKTAEPALTIVSLPVLAPYNIPALLAKFRSVSPGVEVCLKEAEGNLIIPEIVRGNFELGLLRDIYIDQTQFSFIPVCEDEVIAVVSASHPFASRKVIDVTELRNDRFILPDQQTLLHQYYLEICQKKGLTPDIAYTSTHTEEILEMVASGMGVSLMMKAVVTYMRKDTIRYIPLATPATSRIGFAWLRSARLSSRAKQFTEFLKENWSD